MQEGQVRGLKRMFFYCICNNASFCIIIATQNRRLIFLKIVRLNNLI